MRSKYSALILLGVAYVIAAAVVLRRGAEQPKPGEITLRISHWQIEGTVRNAVDAMIRRYEELNPHVHVEQIAVPGSDSFYLPWVRSQLIGGTAPDAVEYSAGWPDIGRFFSSIDEEAVKPNPYNRGTPLEGVPWRDTFIDGMTSEDGFVKALNHYYAATLTTHIPRVVYNRALLKQITGSDAPPANYREFLAVCEQVRTFAREHGRKLVALGNSRDSYMPVVDQLLSNMNVKLSERLDIFHRLRLTDGQLAQAYLRGEWSFDSPEMAAAMQALAEFGQVSTPGFWQRDRDSALTDFVLERALMAIVPSWDASSLLMTCPFEIGAFRYPFPREDDPVYGRITHGPFSEGQVMTGMGFFINRRTAHRAQIVDFLHFMTSQEGSRIFTEISNWQPATVGVKPSAFAARFTQETEGYGWGGGFTMGLNGADGRAFLRTELNQLWSAGGGPEAYRASVRAGLPARVGDDTRRSIATAEHNVAREDVLAAAAVMAAPRERRPDTLVLTTIPNEVQIYQLQAALSAAAEEGR